VVTDGAPICPAWIILRDESPPSAIVSGVVSKAIAANVPNNSLLEIAASLLLSHAESVS